MYFRLFAMNPSSTPVATPMLEKVLKRCMIAKLGSQQSSTQIEEMF